jgi:NitT/TauT family transport system substrate-binding protein
MDRYNLEDLVILRMSPSDSVLALISGSLDAAFIPEQHATVAEANGFPMLIQSQDLWPGMQGDVLVVTTELIEGNPDLVRELMEITQRATDWVNDYPYGTAAIMARQLRIAGGEFSPAGTLAGANLEVTPAIISRSMERVVYATSISPIVVQDTIDFMVAFGYIEEGIEAADILELSFLEGG